MKVTVGCFQVRSAEAEGTRHFLFSSKGRRRKGRGLGSLKGRSISWILLNVAIDFRYEEEKQPFCSSSEKYPLLEHEEGAK